MKKGFKKRKNVEKKKVKAAEAKGEVYETPKKKPKSRTILTVNKNV